MAQPKSQNKTASSENAKKAGKSVKKRDSQASKEKLLQAGIQVFSKKGYNGATTKAISQKAGVNESLIGRYFGGKEGLLISIFQNFVQESLCQDLDYPPQSTVKEELQEYFRHKLLIPKTNDDLAKIVISQSLVDTKFKKRLLGEIPEMKDSKLYDRLKTFKELNDELIKTIMDDIEIYLRGLFIMHILLLETDKESLLDRTYLFIARYIDGTLKI